jgi:peptidylprolyl isomerase
MKANKLIASLIGLLMVFSCFIVSEEGAIKEDVPLVTEGKKVRAHYTLTVEGNIIDSSKEREPMEIQVGSRQVIPGFEKAIKGMKLGEKKSFDVSPEEGYGLEDPEAIQEVSRDKLPPDIKPEPGMTLYAKDKNGRPMPVKIMEVKNDVVVMNFNHPLAGKTLKFEVEIIEILRVQKPVSEEQKENIKK